MRITLGLDFTGGSWPGPLADRDAVAGEAWVGPGGLLGLLETQLGLSGPPSGAAVRAAALIPALGRVDGFWAASAQDNPFFTARTLLRWRDYLALHGWQGEPTSPRLAKLAEVTEGAFPGFPDRLHAVTRALGDRSADVESLVLVDPEQDLTPGWRA